jgi:hypothetical protein
MTPRNQVRAAVDPRFGQVMIEASACGISALAAWLRDADGGFLLDGGEIGHGTVRLDRIQPRLQPSGLVLVEVDGGDLVITASRSGFAELATGLDEFSLWDVGEHLHLDHYRGHPFLGEGSAPVVITLIGGSGD